VKHSKEQRDILQLIAVGAFGMDVTNVCGVQYNVLIDMI